MLTIAIADDFLNAFSRLPKSAHRRVRDFVTKFRENPKSSGLNYEKIRKARDQRLKSVRVTQDYRAIVLAPDAGDVYVLLWVDKHDDAYDWAEDKRVNVHPKTGSLQLLSATNVEELPIAPSAPEASAAPVGRFRDLSDDQLFQAGVPKPLLPAVRAVYSDGDLDAIVPHLPSEAAEVLTGLACGMSLDQAIEEALAKPLTEVGPVDVEDVAAALERPQSGRRFRVVDEEFDLEGALDAPLERWRVFLHPAQRALVERSFKGPTRVLGGAGTGKTVVAMHRAAWIVRHGLPADGRLLFTTFTVNLAKDIEKNLATLLSREEMARVDVVGIDALANRIVREDLGQPVRLATGRDLDRAWQEAADAYGEESHSLGFYRAEWRDVVMAQSITHEEDYVKARRVGRGTKLRRSERRKVWPVFEAFREVLAERGLLHREEILRRARQGVESNRHVRRYASIVVDETQDMTAEALRLLRALAGDEHENDLFMVGDAHQRVYGRPVTLSSCGINVRGRRSRRLRINYRTTDAIRRYAMRVLEGEEFDDLDEGVDDANGYVSLRSGARPEQHHFEMLQEEQTFLAQEIKRLVRGGTPTNHICVVARTKKQVSEFYETALEHEGIQVEVLGRDEPKTDAVRIATMHRIKGLEFPVMFIAGVQEGSMPLTTPELRSDDKAVARQALKQERCLLYVAATRARDKLVMTGHGTRSTLF